MFRPNDVVIHDRCDRDSVLSHGEYGPIGFSFYNHIPEATTRIFIVGNEIAYKRFKTCRRIRGALVKFLRSIRTNATIVPEPPYSHSNLAHLLFPQVSNTAETAGQSDQSSNFAASQENITATELSLTLQQKKALSWAMCQLAPTLFRSHGSWSLWAAMASQGLVFSAPLISRAKYRSGRNVGTNETATKHKSRVHVNDLIKETEDEDHPKHAPRLAQPFLGENWIYVNVSTLWPHLAPNWTFDDSAEDISSWLERH
eukprot:CAMPEP_0174913738 /NCGR_PEP_ID=MMETSP0167-20121228/80477_1 /TAXON_ID=38298 /ORGANISM="Rhodella maculata, Strain CCMP736" /LENGTH=256 /DNA_ID=CAMNT_0016158473 /DNA_START=852 /DNA_END=1622 /DNA_ORIENTATION=+